MNRHPHPFEHSLSVSIVLLQLTLLCRSNQSHPARQVLNKTKEVQQCPWLCCSSLSDICSLQNTRNHHGDCTSYIRTPDSFVPYSRHCHYIPFNIPIPDIPFSHIPPSLDLSRHLSHSKSPFFIYPTSSLTHLLRLVTSKSVLPNRARSFWTTVMTIGFSFLVQVVTLKRCL